MPALQRPIVMAAPNAGYRPARRDDQVPGAIVGVLCGSQRRPGYPGTGWLTGFHALEACGPGLLRLEPGPVAGGP